MGGADLLSSPSSYIEKHRLTGSDEVLRFAVGRNVILHMESQQRVRDSARANSQLLSEYKWDNKTNYAGRILAAQDKLIAYRLFNDTTGEAVRVLEREQRCRHLIKDFRQPTVDLQWAVHAPLLAVLDANANLYIYSVDENGQKLTKYLIILQEGDHTAAGPGRLVWCPFIPEEDSETGEREECHLLGVIQGTQVTLFMLNKIKDQIGRTEVTYDRVREDVKGGMMNIQLESEITACRISPDSTALAVATANGELIFYVMEDWENVQLANRLRPLANNQIEELIFLDNLCTHNIDEQFWKYVCLSSDNGRRLALFDCDDWQCIGKLRFESPNQISRMELLVEPTMRYLFVADYDASNLFCIELSQPAQQQSGAITQLCFAACTQITFCTPMISVVPCALADHYSDSANDLSLEDDDQGVGSHTSNAAVIATLVAINSRSLLELNIEIERMFTVDPSIATAPITPTTSSAPTQALVRSLLAGTMTASATATIPAASNSQKEHQQSPQTHQLSGIQQQQSSQQPPPPPPPQPSAELMQHFQQQRQHPYEALTEIMAGSNKNHNKSALELGLAAINNNNNNNNNAEAIMPTMEMMEQHSSNVETLVDKLAEMMNEKFGELTDKINELSLEVHKLQDENEQLRANQADNLSNVLEKISNELKSREDQMEAFVRNHGSEQADKIIRSTENHLVQHSVNVQRSVDLAQTRQYEQMHLSLERSVVPQVEVFVTQLFSQVNEKFQRGLLEFMEQLKAISQQQIQQQQQREQQAQQQQAPPQPQLTPMEKLNRLLENNQLKNAFELALNQGLAGDSKQQQLLIAVCKKVDPDTFFNAANSSSTAASPTASPPPPLPVPMLLQLLLQLAAKLDAETELKFRYVENALMALNSVVMSSRQIAQSAKAMGSNETLRTVMERLSQTFAAFGEQDKNITWMRQIRLMNSLIANMLTIRH